ncbi:hypothetical protein KUTeg_005817 [Tegillarca granosa]|uniref:Ribitol-5-phosphate transferase FKTN N-terminal domain-containing protein n=1 Tax=Tegillarca granosa TaxID=220873 RepID=A0ABQ9FH15_TEGGR|nr:hypothetical protein KUTeg_005817 [Tegillarca granosa]
MPVVLSSSCSIALAQTLYVHENEYKSYSAKKFPLHIFRQQGFLAVDGIENWPDVPDGQPVPQVSTHIFLQHPKYQEPSIHLVVFYDRADGLWFSQIHMPVTDIKFGSTAGIFNRFKLQTVHVDGTSFKVPEKIHEFLDEIPDSTFIECDKERAKEFFYKYKKDTSEQALKFKRKSRQLIALGKQVLDSIGVRFWLSSGTLLGWYRQCDIIPYAQDVDFGVWIKDHKSDIVPAFEKAGLSVKNVYGKVSDSFELSFQSGDVKLDIFFFYEESDHMWNGGTDAATAIKYKYSFPKFKLCWTIFLDLQVRVPCPTKPYIEANYGKKWFEQVKTWSWKESPANVKQNGVWPKEELDTMIQIYE